MDKQKSAIVIGVIGGAGCGKSSVMEAVRDRQDCLLIQSDHVGHELMAAGQPLFDKVVAAFGNEIVGMDGQIDRAKLAAIVFANEGRRVHLNRLAHPMIEQRIRELVTMQKDQYAFILIETALPRELHFAEFCDLIWWIKTAREDRMKRLMETRGYDFLRVQAMLRSQPTDMEYEKMATLTLQNRGSQEDLAVQVQEQIKYLERGEKCS